MAGVVTARAQEKEDRHDERAHQFVRMMMAPESPTAYCFVASA